MCSMAGDTSNMIIYTCNMARETCSHFLQCTMVVFKQKKEVLDDFFFKSLTLHSRALETCSLRVHRGLFDSSHSTSPRLLPSSGLSTSKLCAS